MTYEGMSKKEHDIYAVARFVRMPCDRIDAFFRVLAMCGYELRKQEPDSDAAGETGK